MTEENTIRIRTADGAVDTGDIPMSVAKEALATMQSADRRGHNRPPMKNTAEDQAVTDHAYGIAAGELAQLIERVEQVQREIEDGKEAQREIFAEAKARGYDTKVMRKLIALRKRDPDDIAEEEAILEMYRAAMGMA